MRGPSSVDGRRRLLRCLLLGAALLAIVAGDDVTTYDVKSGFIPGTKPDVDNKFLTVEAAKKHCEKNPDCLAFTIHGPATTKEAVWVYFKGDVTVAEADKSWSSFIKRPAGLMDVQFSNRLDFALELCWVDMVGSAQPICYGTVAPGAWRNMTSFAGHNFVLKRLVWSVSASAAAPPVVPLDGGLAAGSSDDSTLAGAGTAVAQVEIATRQRAHEWDTRGVPLASSMRAPGKDGANGGAAPLLPAIHLVNRLSQPAEVCSVPQWASRLLQGSLPAGLETCHGVAAAAGGTLEVAEGRIAKQDVLFARQLVGVATIAKGVSVYDLQPMELSKETMRKLVAATGGTAAGAAGGTARGVRPPPARRPARPPPTPPPVSRAGSSPSSPSSPSSTDGRTAPAAGAARAWRPLLGDAVDDAVLQAACDTTSYSLSDTVRERTDGMDAIMDGIRTWVAQVAASGHTAAPAEPPPSALLHMLRPAAATSRDRLPLFGLSANQRRVLRRLAPSVSEEAVAATGAPLEILVVGTYAHPMAMEVATILVLSGGVRRLAVRVTGSGRGEGAPLAVGPEAAAWSAWACTLGVEVTVASAGIPAASIPASIPRGRGLGEASRAGSPATEASPSTTIPATAIPTAAQIVVVDSAGGVPAAPSVGTDAWVDPEAARDTPGIELSWLAVEAGARHEALVIGLARTWNATEPPYTFLSTRTEALSFYLTDSAATALAEVPCSTCEGAARSFLATGCEMGVTTSAPPASAPPASAGDPPWLPSAAVLEWIVEAAVGWPLGYRLADRCDSLAEWMGVGGVDEAHQVRALCSAGGCRGGE